MKRLIRSFYVMGFFMVVLIVSGLLYQYIFFNSLSMENTVAISELTRDYVVSEITASLKKKSQIILDASDFISLQPSNEQVLSFLTTLLKDNSFFASLYFATPENKMVNASGFVPPASFDVRTRPWYIKAVAEKTLIFSEAFINASKDKLIITIAKPVVDSSGTLLGVVGGDVSIEEIVQIVRDNKKHSQGYSFLIDGQRNILAFPKYEYNLTTALKKIEDIDPNLVSQLIGDQTIAQKVTIEGIDGYLALVSIENTDWKIGSFIPMNEYAGFEAQLLRIFFFALLSSMAVLIILAFVQKGNFLTPLSNLEKDISQVDIQKNLEYRLPVDNKDPFFALRTIINRIMDKVESYFDQLQADEEEVRAANEELEVASQAKSAFLANMSHELKTPLNVIMGYTSLLSEKITEAETKEILHIMENSEKNLLHIIDDILDISRIEKGKLKIEPSKVDLKMYLKKLTKQYQSIAQEKGLTFDTVQSEVPLAIWIDGVRLDQIVTNLLNNAVKFTLKGGVKLFINRLRDKNQPSAKEFLQFSVMDTGVGMKKSEIPRLLQPFEQGEYYLTKHFSGTGLGLTIVKDLTQLMQGYLTIESEIAVGSTFTVGFPLIEIENARKEPLPVKQQEVSAKKNRILLAEDDVINQNMMKLVMKRYDVELEIVDNGKRVLEKLENQRYDLILMDLQMPVMNGVEATIELRKNPILKNMPIIGLSAYGQQDIIDQCLAAGMNDYIPKPVQREVLEEKFNKYLSNTEPS